MPNHNSQPSGAQTKPVLRTSQQKIRRSKTHQTDQNGNRGEQTLFTGFNEDMQIKSIRVLGGPADAANRPEASIVFDKEPRETGMTFSRASMRPETVNVATKAVDIWVAQQGSAPGMPWGRSIMFTITDPRFREGKMPTVDIEMVYKNSAHAPVLVKADTARGPVEIGSSFGESKVLQTMNIRLDDAFFGARSTGSDPMKAEPDGCDIRVTAFNSDLEIRSLRIRGYDLDAKPDFTRLVKLESVKTEPDGIFLFKNGDKKNLEFEISNLAKKPLKGRWEAVISDDQGKVLAEKKGESELAASRKSRISVPVDCTDLKHGVYYTDFKFWPDGAGATKPLLAKSVSFGVASSADLPKAQPGEFLYGLDVKLGGGYNNPLLMQWAKAMGTDIIRHGFDSENNFDEVKAALPIYDREGLQVMFICSPRWEENPDARAQGIAGRAQFLERLAGTFKQIHFFELGNEPDLTFFYPGPMEDYTKEYEQLYAAVKRGNPNAFVTNAGLCFFGQDGDRRARRFIELVDPAKIDGWAYHGHGPGVDSERSAFKRIKAATAKVGKGNKPFVETESGMAAKSLSQQHEQARTVIEKMVFAQSVKEPLLMWFRLIMFEEDYGSLNSDREPRAAVIAYRAVVETLRGYAFANQIDTEMDGAEAFLFKQNHGNGRVVVLWSNLPAAYSLFIASGASSSEVRNARVIDMFGNVSPAEVLVDGSIRVPVSEDPVFLKWETTKPDFVVHRAPSLIDTANTIQLVGNTANAVSIGIRNPGDTPLEATLEASLVGTLPASVSPASQTIPLAPGERKQASLMIDAKQLAQSVKWPDGWTVFLNPDARKVDLSQILEIPATLPASDGGTASSKVAFPNQGVIDLGALGATVKEREPAFLFAEVESDTEQTVPVAAGADWWMAWYVNGKPVFDTMEAGNQGKAVPTAHPFKLPLRKGHNLLAVKVLSGSGGFSLAFATPDLLGAANRSATDTNGLRLTLKSGGKTLASETAMVEFTQPLPTLQGITTEDPIDKWERRKPTAILDESSVKNLFDKFPDSSKWWKGPDDLSAKLWLANDADRLVFIVKVRDSVDVESSTAAKPEAGDSITVGVSADGLSAANVYTIGRSGGKMVIAKEQSASGLPVGILPADNPEISATIQPVAKTKDGSPETIYRVSVARKVIGSDVPSVNLTVHDNDSDFIKQHLEWRGGLLEKVEPRSWYRTTFGK